MRGHWRNSERSRRTLISRSLRRANPGVEFPSQPRSNFLVRTCVGTWLSLVEHSLGVRGVGSSNLPVPTNNFKSSRSFGYAQEFACGLPLFHPVTRKPRVSGTPASLTQ